MENEIIKIITYFFLYSFLGWAMESLYISVLQRKIINTGFLHGPFCPIYGFGAVVLYVLLINLKGNIIAIFCTGFLVLSLWEYFVGFLLEKLFKTKYWDYSKNKFNINGRVCLLNSIYWGLLSVFFIEIWNPIVEIQIQKIPQYLLLYIDSVLIIYIIADMVSSSIKIINLPKRVDRIKSLRASVKEKLEELKKATTEKQKVALQNVIDELKLKQKINKMKLERQVSKLKKAFPTIQSEFIKDYLKMRVKEIKEKTKE